MENAEAMTKLLQLVLYFSLLQNKWTVTPSATFEWMLVTYNNSAGTDVTGAKCDNYDGECDHFFRFGLDWQNGSNNASETPILTVVTRPFINEDINQFPPNFEFIGFYNPIRKSFDSWPGGILLKTHVEDYDGLVWFKSEFIDDVIFNLTTAADQTPNGPWSTLTEARGKISTLKFKWRVYCDENYYESDCARLCTTTNDSPDEHYVCDQFGRKVCQRGWDDVDKNCSTKLDDCSSVECHNGATCIDTERSYTCHCTPGFTGRKCEINIDNCSTDPCKNGATCMDGLNDYVCKCPPEFVGKNCSIKACTEQSPCLNGGTCYGDRNCYCSLNFVGAKCQDPMCKLAGCLNGGICTVNGSCLCRPGFEGMRCELDLCSTIAPLCQNGGVCREGKCVCPTEFTGSTCQESSLCSNTACGNGTCIVVRLKDSQVLQPQCQCSEGYTGKRCELKATTFFGETVPSDGNPPKNTSLFTNLFILFVVLVVVFIVVVVVLAVLLCKRSKRKPKATSEAETMADVYSEIPEFFYKYIKNEEKGVHCVCHNLYE